MAFPGILMNVCENKCILGNFWPNFHIFKCLKFLEIFAEFSNFRPNFQIFGKLAYCTLTGDQGENSVPLRSPTGWGTIDLNTNMHVELHMLGNAAVMSMGPVKIF